MLKNEIILSWSSRYLKPKMQRTIKIKLNPTKKKMAETVSTMLVYKETVNRFINMFAGYKYLDKLNYKYLYNKENKDLRIASNYSTNALAYAVMLLNKRLDMIRKRCKSRISKHIQDDAEQHYLFYLLKQPRYIKSIMLRKTVSVDKKFEIDRIEYLNKYLHRILRHEFKNNNIPELKKPMLRTDVVTSKFETYNDYWVFFKDVHHEFMSHLLSFIFHEKLRNKIVYTYRGLKLTAKKIF